MTQIDGDAPSLRQALWCVALYLAARRGATLDGDGPGLVLRDPPVARRRPAPPVAVFTFGAL